MARRYVLDTHACIFALSAPRKLGRRARTALEQVEAGRAEAWIRAAAVAELLLLRELGRTEVGWAEIRVTFETTPQLRYLALDLEQLDEFVALASIRDPFDRLFVSAARSLGAALVTRDQALSESGLVSVVWS
ncbi:type II toxin-antitoxin system VapC family toxin [Myxococcota bacterium]